MSENTSNAPTIIDRFTEFAGKIASITYLQILKNAFTTIMPMFILAGFGVLLNSVIFPLIAEGQTLVDLQTIGTLINNGTLNISGLLVAPMIAYYLAKVRNFDNVMAAVVVVIGSLFVMLPMNIEAALSGSGDMASVGSAVSYNHIGTNGMFAGIIIAFAATELFIKLSNIKQLQISLGEGVPPSVSKSFTVLIPLIITVSVFTILSTALYVLWGTNLIAIITTIVQEPLTYVGSNLWGYLLIFSTGNFLFTLGIHHSVINSSILQPIMLVNMNENMAAAAAGEAAPNIINESFRSIFGTIGGTGGTFALLIAIFIFSKYQPYKNIGKLALGPGLFNINEPIIFGLPVVFNIPMMIPFVLAPILGSVIGYFFTWVGFIEPFTVLIPWTTPPLVNAFLASGGDWKAIIVQLIIIASQVVLYVPFLQISARVAKQQAEELTA